MLAREEYYDAVSTAPAEVTEIHTGILRLALALEETRGYLEHLDPSVPPADRARVAFEQRWLGTKSQERVKYVLLTFAARFDAYPNALATLRRWRSMDLATRQLVGHWHLQLSDPIYRRFSGSVLPERRAKRTKVDRDVAFRWMKNEFASRWSEATLVQFASKLLSAAHDAGLVTRRDPRELVTPKVSDLALAYLLYLLRETRFEGTLTGNPYLASVGIDPELLAARARSLPGLRLRRQLELSDFEWDHADLRAWGEAVL